MINTPLLVRAADVLLSDYLSVRKQEEIIITTDSNTDQRVVGAIMAIADKIGAKATMSLAPKLPIQGQLADPYITRMQKAAVKACDVWIDLAFPYFAGSHTHEEAIKTDRVRYLLCGDLRAASFSRLFGMIDLDQYFDARFAFDEVFGGAIGKTCRITSPLGTDVRFELTNSQLNQSKPRHASMPGMFLVPGSCSIAPKVETVKGTIVMNTVFHEFYEHLTSPATITVDNQIKTVSGGGPSRLPLERAMRKAGGGEFGQVIHFTHGLHPAARFAGEAFIEDMRSIGANAIGLGKPWWEPGGGESHPDAVLMEHSVWIENEKIIEDGVIIGPGKLAAKAAELAPILL